MGSALTAAIRAANLPDLLERHYPKSITRGLRVRPFWRSQTRDGDAALKRWTDGAWVLTDFALSKSWNAYQFLTDLCSYTPRDAARLLIAESGVQDRTTHPTSAVKPAQAWLEPEVLPELPECITDFLRLNRLYFRGRLTLEPDGTVSREAQMYLLEPLADWLASCAVELGLGTFKQGGAS
jgi:hypothetical protein